MKMKHFLSFVACACLLGAWGLFPAAGMAYEKARIIAGVSNGSSCGPQVVIPVWEPLNEADREYVGPLDAKRGEATLVASPATVICSYKDLVGIVQGMAASLSEERKVELKGPDLTMVRSWLPKINTYIFGTASIQKQRGEVVLKMQYTARNRIWAAFMFPALREKLSEEDSKALDTCVNWICSNISTEMPIGLKIKKVHDTLVDYSSSSLDEHDALSVILKGVGSSRAYAEAAQLLLNLLCFDCRLVQGSMQQTHYWNLVQLDNDWFHLDVYADEVYLHSRGRMYEYCLLTDKEMSADHKWERNGLYPTTPETSSVRFYLRNELRRSWKLRNAHRERSEETPSAGKQQLRDAGRSVVKRDWQQRNPFASLKQKLGKSLPTRKDKEEKEKVYVCVSADSINDALDDRLKSLNEKPLKLKCDAGVAGWRMRQMIARSALAEYAGEYNVVYDERDGSMTIDFKFSPYRRVLAAARDKELEAKLPAAEQDAVKKCRSYVQAYAHKWKNRQQKVKSVYMPLIAPQKLVPHGAVSTEDIQPTGPCHPLDAAQSLYVICHLMDVPCRMVHGRTSEEYHSWNLVQTDKDAWYHADPASDAEQKITYEHLCQYLLVPDDKMKKTHAWDASVFED